MKDSTYKRHSPLSLSEPDQIKFQIQNSKNGSHRVFPTSTDARLEPCSVKAQS